MKKQTYAMPRMEVIEVKMQQMLCGSIKSTSSGLSVTLDDKDEDSSWDNNTIN